MHCLSHCLTHAADRTHHREVIPLDEMPAARTSITMVPDKEEAAMVP
jgi:hypothetical protein